MEAKERKASAVIPLEDNSEVSPERNLESEISVGAIIPAEEVVKVDLSGDPLASVAISLSEVNRSSWLPEDLRISWSWPHVLIFLVVGFGSLLTIQVAAVMMVAGSQRLSQKQLEELMLSKPQLLIGSNLLWFAFLFFFLFVTLSMLREAPFWKSLGWRQRATASTGKPIEVWKFFGVGCGLAVFVGLLTSRVKQPENAPIEAIFKNRSGALLFMAMAVLVAPLVEETIFRGYLYPFFAGKFALLARTFGKLESSSVFFGRLSGIVVTGVLFGLMHGVQLGWTFGLVATLATVGIVLTFVRARTGSVFASFLVHLGYNTMIAITSIVVTKGFTQMPTMPPGH